MSVLSALVGQPMAAPETPRLRAMRLAILGCFMALVAILPALQSLRQLIGNAAGAIVAVLMVVLAVLVPVYVRAKNRADDAHLDHLIAQGAGE